MNIRIRFRLGLIVLAMVSLWGQQSQRAVAQVPDENRKELVNALGTPFIVLRDKVLDELKVSDEQKEKLLAIFDGADHGNRPVSRFLGPEPGRNGKRSSMSIVRTLTKS